MVNYKKLAKKYLNRSTDTNAQMVTALAVGLVAGAIISMLFAPKKGAETRKDLAHRSKRFYGSLKDKFGVACDQFTEDIKASTAKAERVAKKKTNFAKSKKSNQNETSES